MPEPVDKGRVPGKDPLDGFDRRLEAFEASRRRNKPGAGLEAAGGYRLLGQMLGGVLGGIGLGWLLDHYAHTGPFGLVGGLLIGTVLAIVSTVRTASQMSARAPVAAASPADEDDDEA